MPVQNLKALAQRARAHSVWPTGPGPTYPVAQRGDVGARIRAQLYSSPSFGSGAAGAGKFFQAFLARAAGAGIFFEN